MVARAAPEKGQRVVPDQLDALVAETDVVADAADVQFGVGFRWGFAARSVAAPDAFEAGVFGVDGGGGEDGRALVVVVAVYWRARVTTPSVFWPFSACAGRSLSASTGTSSAVVESGF